MSIRIATGCGCTIENADLRALDFLRAEWRYYDGIADPDPTRITLLDLLAPVMVNAYFWVGADRLRRIHEGFVERVEPLLADIPVDADLRDYDPELAQVQTLFEAAVSIPGVLVPVTTKILHRKRRRLIPILDNVVLDHYLKASGAAKQMWKTQDKSRAPAVAKQVLVLFRQDLLECYEPLRDLSAMAEDAGYPVTPLRFLELLIWSQVEPRGYYRG